MYHESELTHHRELSREVSTSAMFSLAALASALDTGTIDALARLAEQNDIGCILHTHSVWGTLLSDHFFEDGGFEIEGFEMLKGLEGVKTHEHNHWLPIFENTQDIPALAELVRERLSDPMEPMTHGFLIRKHGLYTWGKDVFSARRHIEIYEFLFECIARKNGFPVV